MHNRQREELNNNYAEVMPNVYRCDCRLLSGNESEVMGQDEKIVPVPLALYAQLEATIAQTTTSIYPLSLILLHVMQWELAQEPLEIMTLQKRQRCHAPPGLLEQVLVNVRRVIRIDDQIVVEPDVAAALVLPYVDEQGVKSIHDRIYHSVSLLQAETVIPPLKREAVIQLGIGTCVSPADAGEVLLRRAAGQVSQISFKPTVQVQPWIDGIQMQSIPVLHMTKPRRTKEAVSIATTTQGKIPFMHLPAQLPARLRHIIPHSLACELRCAPVGRNHSSLTVAMANPRDAQALDQLAETTGMAIFPVACEEDALDQLLDQQW